MKSKKINNWQKKIIFLFVVFGFNSLTIFSSDKLPRTLRGKPFTDHTSTINMPASWKKKPIVYDKWSEGADIAISLDQHLYPALLPLINEYAKIHALKIKVKNGTCGITAGMLSQKKVDIGGFCCPPGLVDRLPGLKFHTLGIAAIALLVHKENPTKNITIREAREVFQGKLDKWSDLKSNKEKKLGADNIQSIGRLHCKKRPGHWRLLLAHQDLFSPELHEVGSIDDMIVSISKNRKAIGYEVLWMAQLYRNKGLVKPLMIDGFVPTESKHLISGKYPIYRTFNITTWNDKNQANDKALHLVEYILKRVSDIDKKFGIIPFTFLREAGWKFHGNELVGELSSIVNINL